MSNPIHPITYRHTFVERLTTVHRLTSPPVVERQQPRPIDPAPGSNTVLDTDPFATPPSGGDTLTGATTQDLHGGIGQPVSGMSSKELHHDGKAHKKRTLQGKDQYGTADEIFGEQVEQRGEV